MLSAGRTRRSSRPSLPHHVAHAFPLLFGIVALATVASCGSRAGDSAARPGRADGALAPHSASATKAHSREQEILAALPLARRVPRIIRKSDGTQTFLFEGYYSGRELVCVRAMPPPQGDTTSVDRYFFDHGRLLSYAHEMRLAGPADGVPDLAVHALFAPDGTTLDFEMIVKGEPRPIRSLEREALLRMTREMAKVAYDEVLSHPNG